MFVKLVGFIKYLIIFGFLSSLIAVLLFRLVPVPLTPTVFYRLTWPQKDWVPIQKMGPYTVKCALASEDQRFFRHHGFDLIELEKAYKQKNKKKKVRGASTISQQTAKNIFLLPVRSYIRKGFEVYFTGLIELFWTKKRIIEVYLNIIEMGDGIYGIEAAARKYYKKPAAKLSLSESALIVACLPNPRKWTPLKHGSYVRRKQQLIIRYIPFLDPLPWSKAKK